MAQTGNAALLSCRAARGKATDEQGDAANSKAARRGGRATRDGEWQSQVEQGSCSAELRSAMAAAKQRIEMEERRLAMLCQGMARLCDASRKFGHDSATVMRCAHDAVAMLSEAKQFVAREEQGRATEEHTIGLQWKSNAHQGNQSNGFALHGVTGRWNGKALQRGNGYARQRSAPSWRRVMTPCNGVAKSSRVSYWCRAASRGYGYA